MQSLLRAVPVLLRQSGDDEMVREQLVFAVWRRVAGEAVVRVTAPLALDQQKLRIAVLDRTWQAQLERIAHEYLARIGALLASPLVTWLQFEVEPARVKNLPAPSSPQPIVFHRTEALIESLREDAAAIRDEELRTTFLHLAARAIERQEDRTLPPQ
jgi:hypothetical protein